MKNIFCINKRRLVELFWRDSTKNILQILEKKFGDKYSLENAYKQIKTGKGEIAEYFEKKKEKFAEVTENNEIANAIILSDFYLFDFNSRICFNMKSRFRKKEIKTCKELIENIDGDTEIDCLIRNSHRECKFQLKEYPEKYKKWGISEIIKYFDKSILPVGKYNNKSNRDLIIVITIKPKQNSDFKEAQDFNKIHAYLSKKDVKLLEIDFLYNRNNEDMVWFQVFPENGYSKIPFQKLSYQQAKR